MIHSFLIMFPIVGPMMTLEMMTLEMMTLEMKTFNSLSNSLGFGCRMNE